MPVLIIIFNSKPSLDLHVLSSNLKLGIKVNYGVMIKIKLLVTTFQDLFDVDSWDKLPRSQKIDSFVVPKKSRALVWQCQVKLSSARSQSMLVDTQFRLAFWSINFCRLQGQES